MKKTLLIISAVLGCMSANAQNIKDINAVVARQGNGQDLYQHVGTSETTSTVTINGNGVSVTNGETQPKQYNYSDGNITVLFASAINSNKDVEDLDVSYPIVVLPDGVLTVSGTLTNGTAENLVIEDGGQLSFGSGTAKATVKKEISGYASKGDNDKYCLVATPMAATPVGGLTTGTYDLYYYDEPTAYWMNQKVSDNHFTELVNSQGYLYANAGDITLSMAGELVNNSSPISLSFQNTSTLKGFNLIGNPFTCNAYLSDYRSFYRMNEAGTELEVAEGAIHPYEGVFVQASQAGESVSFTKEAPAQQGGTLALAVRQGRGSSIDRAMLRFGEGAGLGKMSLNERSTKLYIPQNGKDFASVSTSATRGETPVAFKAQAAGTYTVSVEAADLDLDYLHLIDRLSGADTDMLLEKEYSFNAMPGDRADRFLLVFGRKAIPSDTDDSFVTVDNGNAYMYVEGEGRVEVIDALGRTAASYTASGSFDFSVNGLPKGAYVVRLSDDNGVKAQKIVF